MDADRIIQVHDHERRLKVRWWALSIGLHLGGLAALIWWSGLREWIFTPSRPPEPVVTRDSLDGAREVLLGLYRKRYLDAAAELGAVAREISAYSAERAGQVQREDPRLVDQPPPLLSVPPDAAADAGLAAVYAVVLEREHLVEAAYEHLRAIDLVSLQRLPMSRALIVAAMPRTVRRPMAAETVEQPAADLAKLEALKTELVDCYLEAQAAVAAAERLRSLARRVMGLETATDLVLADLSGMQAAETSVPFLDDSAYVGALLFPTDKVADGVSNVLDARPVLGTSIGDCHRAADWLALDTWWIVGPFEHPGTARPEQLDRVYPPEGRPGMKVDLDEAYAGKAGRVLRWQWHQSNDGRINPLAVPGMQASARETYAIWYAATEVWCDAPRTAWAAFGSDDFSAAWVNGELVYQSGRSPQAWQPFKPDAFRQIRLNAGHNRFLVKLENKGGTTGFSVCLNLDPGL